jgi:HK97 gp10 family phage protein
MSRISATSGLTSGDRSDLLVIQENNAEQIASAINQAVALALEEIGQKAERHAKAECPVDTGRLRNSITHAIVSEDTVAIGTNVEYGIFVHEGARGRPGVPFLRNAAQNHTTEYRNVLKKHLQGQ